MNFPRAMWPSGPSCACAASGRKYSQCQPVGTVSPRGRPVEQISHPSQRLVRNHLGAIHMTLNYSLAVLKHKNM